MKKIFFAVLGLSLLVTFPVFAEETPKKEMTPMIGKECIGMGGQPSMVATDEGGVIVLAGNKLIKYDADLNIVKEVVVKVPMGGKTCPMMRSMDKDETPTAENGKKAA